MPMDCAVPLPNLPPTSLRRRHVATAAALALLLGLADPAGAVPPPVPRDAQTVDAAPNGPELVLQDTVRPYQPVELLLQARTGDRLLLRLDNPSRVLVLQLEAPGGQAVLDGAVPGPDGLVWQLAHEGLHRVRVAVSGDAARSGRSASFTLGLRLRRDGAVAPGR